jgi:uncharacterized Zn finger protein
MKDKRPPSMGERWRRITSHGVDLEELERARESMPSIRNPRLRIQPGAIMAEMEGSMGALHEVSVHVPMLSPRIWPQVVRVMRRSASMLEQMRQGLVPRSFDRLIARIAGEPVFPEPRRVTSACTCSEQERPCRHILAMHELFARRIEERPYELLTLRGVDLRKILEQASRAPEPGEMPPLSFGSREEPVLFPDGEEVDLDVALTIGQIRNLLGSHQSGKVQVVAAAIDALRSPPPVEPPAAGLDG